MKIRPGLPWKRLRIEEARTAPRWPSSLSPSLSPCSALHDLSSLSSPASSEDESGADVGSRPRVGPRHRKRELWRPSRSPLVRRDEESFSPSAESTEDFSLSTEGLGKGTGCHGCTASPNDAEVLEEVLPPLGSPTAESCTLCSHHADQGLASQHMIGKERTHEIQGSPHEMTSRVPDLVASSLLAHDLHEGLEKNGIPSGAAHDWACSGIPLQCGDHALSLQKSSALSILWSPEDFHGGQALPSPVEVMLPANAHEESSSTIGITGYRIPIPVHFEAFHGRLDLSRTRVLGTRHGTPVRRPSFS